MSPKFTAAAAVGALALVVFSAAPARAGECPAGSVAPNAGPAGPSAPEGVTDTVIGAIDLSQQYNLPGRTFRMRRLVIQPGGVVPTHSHAERPAHIYVVQGSIVEHRSNCAVPIVHKQGEVAVEAGNYSHWWKNTSKKTVVLLSSDLLPESPKP